MLGTGSQNPTPSVFSKMSVGGPEWWGSVGWASSHTVKGHRFDYGLGSV